MLLSNKSFKCDSKILARLENSWFTSFIFKIDWQLNILAKEKLNTFLNEIKAVLLNDNPNAIPIENFNASHITIRSIVDFQQQDLETLTNYADIIRPCLAEWLGKMSETRIYMMGLFMHIHKTKGLSIGIRIYPTLPLIQTLRGEVGLQLYSKANSEVMRPINAFHTMLTHCTLLRFRDVTFPIADNRIAALKDILIRADAVVFGEFSELEMSDFSIRNGQSDRLLLTDNGINVGQEITF